MTLQELWGLEFQAETKALLAGWDFITTAPVELVIMGAIAVVTLVWTLLFWEKAE